MATRDAFSHEEQQQLKSFPDINRAELILYFTLTASDEVFLCKYRGGSSVLGVSVQLCTLPWLGFVPDDVPLAPAAAVARLSERLGIPVGDLRVYGEREQTRTDHLREVARFLGWRQMDSREWKDLDEFLFGRAMEHDSPKLLFQLGCEYLKSARVIRPGVVNILERVAHAREQARDQTWMLVEHLARDATRRADLDRLLVVDPELGRTPLSWLGMGATQASPAAVKDEISKLRYLRRLDAHTLDLSMLPMERRRFLSSVGRRLKVGQLAGRDPDRKYPILLTLLEQYAVDMLDEVLLLFDQCLSARESAAKAKLDETLADRARAGENRQQLLDEILTVVLDIGISDDMVGRLLREGIGMDRMRAAWAAKQERLPRDHGRLAMMRASMGYLRQFVPEGSPPCRTMRFRVDRPDRAQRCGPGRDIRQTIL